ncbi:hypothetical protein K488DRAFT_23138, partial [Vararia minispora EC-137]
ALVGRGTRGYIAVDVDDQQLVFLKDVWPAVGEETETLSVIQTYRRLAEHQVPFLADFAYGGEVPLDWRDTTSPAQSAPNWMFARDHPEYAARTDGDVRLVGKKHVRMVFKKIGRPLHTVKSPKELATITYHALISHDVAVRKALILHRDISNGNILIDKDGKGMLIDWE